MSPTQKRPSFRTLRTFARGYLHQDFLEEYGHVRGAAVQFGLDAGPGAAERLQEDLDRLLTLSADWPLPRLRAFLTDTLGAQWHLGSRRELAALARALAPTDGSDRP